MVDGFLRSIYQALPGPVKTPAREAYFTFGPRVPLLDVPDRRRLTDAFVDQFFDSHAEFERLTAEYRSGPAADIRRDAVDHYRSEMGRDGLSDIGVEAGERYYALLRKMEPETVVETGVAHGFSTLVALLAIDANGTGRLHSIDLPFEGARSNTISRRLDRHESFLERLHIDPDGIEKSVDGVTNIELPPGREPGWIVPDDLRDRWELHVGITQIELPRLRCAIDAIDVFVHDSDHSMPCQLFEYELAWSWLSPGGLLLTHDAKEAFDVFRRERTTGPSGFIDLRFGYAVKAGGAAGSSQ